MDNQDFITWDYINIILNDTLDTLDQLLLHLEGTNNIPKEIFEFNGRDVTKFNGYGNENRTMNKVEAKADLKQRFDNLTSCLEYVKKEGGNLWWLPIIVNFSWYSSHTIDGIKKQRHGRLPSYLDLIDNELQEILEIAQGKFYRYCKLKFGMPV